MPTVGDGMRRTLHGACRRREIAKTGDRGKAREGCRNDATVFEHDDLVGGLECFGPAGGWPTFFPGWKKRMAGTIFSVLLRIVWLEGFSFFRFFRFGCSILFDFGRLWAILDGCARAWTNVEDRGRICAGGWCLVIGVDFGGGLSAGRG